MDLLEKSMMFERAYGRLTNIYQKLSKEYEKNPTDELKDKIAILKGRREKVRKASDAAFLAYRNTVSDLNEDGIDNLVAAILKQAVYDYEDAICKRDDKKREELEEWAKTDAKNFTPVDMTSVLDRVNDGHKVFVKIVHQHKDEIIEDSHSVQKQRGYPMRHLCPVCGGNIYGGAPDKRRTQTTKHAILFRCGRCNLFEWWW